MTRLTLILTILGLAFASPALANTNTDKPRFLVELYSGVGSNAQGDGNFIVGGKGVVYVAPNLRLGGELFYNRSIKKMQNGGGAFVADYVLPLSRSIDFFVGANTGLYSGTNGPAIFIEPGAGFMFRIGKVALEWRLGARIPWYINSELNLRRDVQGITTLSLAFGRW